MEKIYYTEEERKEARRESVRLNKANIQYRELTKLKKAAPIYARAAIDGELDKIGEKIMKLWFNVHPLQ